MPEARIDGWTGQDITLSTTTILLPSNSTIEEAISIRSHLDHGGTGRCDSNEAECSELTRSISFDTSAPNQGAFPLIVVESGIQDGKKVDRKFKVPFDRSHWHYRAPKGLVLDLE